MTLGLLKGKNVGRVKPQLHPSDKPNEGCKRYKLY